MARTFLPGTATWYASDSPASDFSAIFEDDGETGYFYAYDRSVAERPVLDLVLIYEADSVVERRLESTAAIIWSPDGSKTALLLNDYPHAVIDFAARCSYCRSNFPPPPSGWRRRSWDETLIGLFPESV